MRILFLSDGPRVPLVTGDRLRNWRLVECLARRHHVAWWSLLEPGATAGAAPAGVEEASLAVPPGWQEPGTKLRKWLCAPFSSDPLLVLGLPLQGPGAEIARAAAGFDVLHCAHLITWRAVPESLAPRCVVDLCDSMSLRYELLLRNSPGVRLRDRSLLAYTLAGQAGRLRRYERSMPARAGAALVVAARDREHLRAPELHVVPNGVDTAYFRRSGPREPGRLVFFGNLRYGPNADAAARLARETLPAVRARVPAAHLHLVGADPGPEVVALGRLPGVTLVGRVEDLRPELSAAQVFACPLQVASGLQNKVLEALAMELPAVVTPVAAEGLELAAGRDLWVCPAGPEFAAGLAQLLEDGPERERLAQAGRVAVAERYTWDRAAGMLEAIYAEVIERAAGGPGRPLAGRAAPGYAP